MCNHFQFNNFWSLVVLLFIPTSFCDRPYHPIYVDLLDQQPGITISNLTDIEYRKYAINILNINANVSFLLIQIHSYHENITISYDDPLQPNSFTTGTNIGLVWSRTLGNQILEDGTVRFFLMRRLSIAENLTVLLAVSTYDKNDPIPGGCNLSFETMIAPYQKIAYDDNIIRVTSQRPSRNEVFCKTDGINTDMYYMYLKEHNNATEEYFSGIKKMMTVESILKYGTKVPSGIGFSKFNQTYNLYRGTGRVFAVVSTLNGQSSAYVPAISFGCNVEKWSEECVGPLGAHWKLICAMLLVLGNFICFGGHRFFKIGLFIVGFTFGAIVTLLGVANDNYFSNEVKAIYAFTIGILFGLLWLILWWRYGAPLVSIQLTCLLAGTLIASIVLYNELGDIQFLSNDSYFWLVFSLIVAITLLPIIIYPSRCHMVALSLLGSYAFVVALNYYVGGNMPYILINTYRRIAVKNFGLAVIDPPYQLLDFAQTLLWALLFGLGVVTQYRYSLGKAPFPPHRAVVTAYVNDMTYPEDPALSYRVIESPVNERTPLIPSQQRELPPPYQA